MAKGYQGGRLSDGTPLNVAVYRAYRNAGLSHPQAMAITAEVGRENGFQSSVLFAHHTDPAADSRGRSILNTGMLSWNGSRGANITNFLTRAGVMQNGVMQRNQANLNAQAAFSVQEMKGAYRNRLQNFWNNPNANPESFAREVGKNYIGWAYGQNSIRAKGGGRIAFNWQSHDARRRGYLNVLGGMLGDKNNYQPMPGNFSDAPTFQPPPLAKNFEQFAAQFKPKEPAFVQPPIQKGFDTFAKSFEQAQSFVPPQTASNFDQFAESQQTQAAFTPPTVGNNFDEFAKQFG